MKATKLIGKLAIRTQPIKLGIDDMTGEINYDYSYTSNPINILKVTENHIVYNYVGTPEEGIFEKDVYILDKRYIDNNWIDYSELIDLKDVKQTNNLTGKYVETKYGHKGIVIRHFKRTGKSNIVHIIEGDGRIYFCPESDIIYVKDKKVIII